MIVTSRRNTLSLHHTRGGSRLPSPALCHTLGLADSLVPPVIHRMHNWNGERRAFRSVCGFDWPSSLRRESYVAPAHVQYARAETHACHARHSHTHAHTAC